MTVPCLVCKTILVKVDDEMYECPECGSFEVNDIGKLMEHLGVDLSELKSKQKV